jgi:hypothetical protein
MTDQELVSVVLKFRRGIIGRRRSTGMCWCVCAPLGTMLEIMGVDNDLIEGTVHGEHHFYLMLRDGRVLDPTGDQFKGLNLPKVFLGRPGRLYRRQKNWSRPGAHPINVLSDVIRREAMPKKRLTKRAAA